MDSLQTLKDAQRQSYSEIFRLLDAMDAKLDRLLPRIPSPANNLLQPSYNLQIFVPSLQPQTQTQAPIDIQPQLQLPHLQDPDASCDDFEFRLEDPQDPDELAFEWPLVPLQLSTTPNAPSLRATMVTDDSDAVRSVISCLETDNGVVPCKAPVCCGVFGIQNSVSVFTPKHHLVIPAPRPLLAKPREKTTDGDGLLRQWTAVGSRVAAPWPLPLPIPISAKLFITALVRLQGRPPPVVIRHHLSSWSHLMPAWPPPGSSLIKAPPVISRYRLSSWFSSIPAWPSPDIVTQQRLAPSRLLDLIPPWPPPAEILPQQNGVFSLCRSFVGTFL